MPHGRRAQRRSEIYGFEHKNLLIFKFFLYLISFHRHHNLHHITITIIIVIIMETEWNTFVAGFTLKDDCLQPLFYHHVQESSLPFLDNVNSFHFLHSLHCVLIYLLIHSSFRQSLLTTRCCRQ